MKKNADIYTVQAVSRALDLLEQFQDCNEGLGISDLSHRLNLPKNNVFRLVVTLRSRHYIEMNDLTGKYHLGLMTHTLGQTASRQADYLKFTRPILQNLKMLTHETCYFSIIKDSHAYYLDGVESDLPVRVTSRIGSRLPLHCTAAGKAQLAYLGQDEMLKLINDMELVRLTPRTITDRDQLQNELRNIARQGYAVEDQEHDSGVIEIAAPVVDFNGKVIGSLCISVPSMRLDGHRLENELVPLALRESERLSTDLGYRKIGEAFDNLELEKPVSHATNRKLVKKSSAADRRKGYY